MKPTVIRIVDDDSDVCDSLSCLLSLEGWEIRIYTDPKEFLAGDLLTDPGCLILDFRFPTTNGLEVQKVLIERQIRMPIIFLTAHGDIPLAVKAMQRGAVDFLTKPVDTDHLIAAIERALRVDTLHRQFAYWSSFPGGAAAEHLFLDPASRLTSSRDRPGC